MPPSNYLYCYQYPLIVLHGNNDVTLNYKLINLKDKFNEYMHPVNQRIAVISLIKPENFEIWSRLLESYVNYWKVMLSGYTWHGPVTRFLKCKFEDYWKNRYFNRWANTIVFVSQQFKSIQDRLRMQKNSFYYIRDILGYLDGCVPNLHSKFILKNSTVRRIIADMDMFTSKPRVPFVKAEPLDVGEGKRDAKVHKYKIGERRVIYKDPKYGYQVTYQPIYRVRKISPPKLINLDELE